MQKRLPDTCLEATFACVIFLMLFDTLVNLVTKSVYPSSDADQQSWSRQPTPSII